MYDFAVICTKSRTPTTVVMSESDGSVERPAQVRRLSPLVREPTGHSSSPASGASSLACVLHKAFCSGHQWCLIELVRSASASARRS
eukprot:1646969-Prymnesium_polylepis.1